MLAAPGASLQRRDRSFRESEYADIIPGLTPSRLGVPTHPSICHLEAGYQRCAESSCVPVMAAGTVNDSHSRLLRWFVVLRRISPAHVVGVHLSGRSLSSNQASGESHAVPKWFSCRYQFPPTPNTITDRPHVVQAEFSEPPDGPIQMIGLKEIFICVTYNLCWCSRFAPLIIEMKSA
jgi:hypothetical protein